MILKSFLAGLFSKHININLKIELEATKGM